MTSVDTLEVPPVADRHAAALRPLLRDALVYVGVVLLAPLWLPVWAEGRLGFGKQLFTTASELLSLVPGLPGIFFRRSFYRMTLEGCGTDCHIGFGTTLAHRQVRIGVRVYVGGRCTLGQVTLGDDVLIGSNVDILSGRHQHHFDTGEVPVRSQGGRYRRVTVGRNTWVGNSSVVMADIGSDCVVGAGSVVVKPIPERSVAVGNPAAVVRTRAA